MLLLLKTAHARKYQSRHTNLSFTGADQNIDSVYFMDLKLTFLMVFPRNTTVRKQATMCTYTWHNHAIETSSVVIEIDQGLCGASKLHWKTVQSHGADAAVKYKPRIESNTRAKKRKCSLKQSLDYGEMPLFLRATNEYLEKRSGERNVDRQQDTSTAGGRWRRQHKTELDGDKTWSHAVVKVEFQSSRNPLG